MSNRTWTCVPCRKSYRRVQTLAAVECPICHQPCEYVHWKMRVPSPRRVKAWDEFWTRYRAEKALLDAYHRGELRQSVNLELLNMQLHVEKNRRPAKRKRKQAPRADATDHHNGKTNR